MSDTKWQAAKSSKWLFEKNRLKIYKNKSKCGL